MEDLNLKEIFTTKGITEKFFMAEFNKFKNEVLPGIKAIQFIEESKKDFQRWKESSEIFGWLKDSDEDLKDDYQPTEKDYKRFAEYKQEFEDEYEDCCPSESRDSGYSEATDALREFVKWLNS